MPLRHYRSKFGALVVLLAIPQICLAQAFVEKISPPVLQRGRVNRIKISGTQVEQTLGLWTSVPRMAITAVPVDPGNGTAVALDVTVPADAPLGLYGLRLATKSGLSNVHLFVIDELPVTLRTNGVNDTLAVSLPACIAAPSRKAAVDRYAIDVQAGQRVTFEVVGNRLGKDYDPLVVIRDAAGRTITQGDNDAGLFFDCRFEVAFARAGRYTVEVSDARYNGDPTWSYVLRMGDFPVARTAVPAGAAPGESQTLSFPQMPVLAATVLIPADHPRGFFWHAVRLASDKPATWIPLDASSRRNQAEVEPNDAVADATPVQFPAALCGVLDRPGDEDWFAFEMKKGESLRVRSQTSRIGSAADLELALFEPSNDKAGYREVLRNDETNVRDNERNTTFVDEANFTFAARADGLHRLLVRDLTGAGSSAHTYRVDVGPNTPELSIKSDVDVLTVPKGSYQPVSLKVTRTGFAGPIELSLFGAPAGVSLEPAVIAESETEIVCRLTATDAAVEGLATLQIVGRARVENKTDKEAPPTVIEAIATAHPLVDRQLRNKDRITYALRADQQQLPPSLTDRIAVQITPPAPFDVELPDQAVLLPKYQTADFRIVTTRRPGFDGPLSFDLAGGQIGEEAEERVQVYGRVPQATMESPTVTGRLSNRILTQYLKHRVDVRATGRIDDRDVTLFRTFTLDVKPAFDPTFADAEALPGESMKLLLKANRLATFDGPITATATQTIAGITYPEKIELAAGKPEADVEVKVKPDTKPGRYQVRYESTGTVGGYQELRNTTLTITVKAPPMPKK